MKRFLSLFLFAILFGGYAIAYDFSAVCSSGQTLYYNITFGNEVELTSENTSSPYYTTYPTGCLVIPGTVTYNDVEYWVTSIGYDAFSNCSELTSVTIDNPARSIGNSAFYGCSGLTSITIGNSVESIGGHAFSDCCGLTSVTIPNSVMQIDFDAFNLVRNIVYNGSATGSPWGALTVNGYIEGYLVYSDETKTYLTGCSIQATSVTIPNSVTSIGSFAFQNCSRLISVTIPNSVTSIGDDAFQNCNGLTGELTIPTSVTSIGDYAFSGCRGLTSVTLPESITNIGTYAFDNVRNIVYNGSATGSPWGALTVNGYIEGYLVYSDETKTYLTGCNIQATSVTIPNSVTKIGGSAFSGCKGLTGEMIIPNSVTSIGGSAFYNCSGLTSVTIGESVRIIGRSAFTGCSGLTEVTIPNSVTSILFGTFEACSGLTSVTIGNSVANIEQYAFRNCRGIESIVIDSGNTIYDSRNNCNAIIETESNTLIQGCMNTEIPNSVTSIGSYAFQHCSGLRSIVIPNSVTNIGGYAFQDCSGLTEATIGEGVTSIGARAFDACSGLASVTIGNSVANIGQNAFYNCSRLTSVTIPNSVTSIGSWAFGYCSELTSVTIGDSVASIGQYAFYNCSGLTSVTIPNSVTNIGTQTFYKCSGLTSVTIGNSVTRIDGWAFGYCSELASVTIGDSVTSISDWAFGYCSGLTNIYSNPTTPPSIQTHTFDSYTATVLVPCGSADEYRSANRWSNFQNIQQSCPYNVGETLPDIEISCSSDPMTIGGDYENDVLYNQTFICNEGSRILLKFTSLPNDADNDYVEVYDKDGTLRGRYYGSSLPRTIYSAEETLSIVFSSNSSTNGTWGAEVSAICPEDLDEIALGCDGAYAINSSYSNLQYTRQVFRATNPESQILLDFAILPHDDDNDFVEVYDGEDESAPLIGRYYGYGQPRTITSTGNVMTIVFISNASVSGNWSAAVTADCPDTFYFPTSGYTEYTTCNATLYDDGGPTGNYSNGLNDQYIVLRPGRSGQVLHLEGSYEFQWYDDYITIYDGEGTSGEILWGGGRHGHGYPRNVYGQGCTTHSSGWEPDHNECVTFNVDVTSKTGSLTISFHTNESDNCAGFAFNITCEDMPTDDYHTGILLYKEDFGGNSATDPVYLSSTNVSSSSDPEVYNRLNSACDYSLSNSGQTMQGGYYVLRKNGCDEYQYFNYIDDHTHPGNVEQGYLFEVDGGSNPDCFYKYKVENPLCEGVTLLTSFWVANINNEQTNENNFPNLTIQFAEDEDGIIELMSVSTGPVRLMRTNGCNSDANDWLKYEASMEIPAGRNAVWIRIINNSTSSNGNDFALDDIEVRAISPIPQAVISGENEIFSSINICENSSVTLQYHLDDTQITHLLWQRGLHEDPLDLNSPIIWEDIVFESGEWFQTNADGDYVAAATNSANYQEIVVYEPQSSTSPAYSRYYYRVISASEPELLNSDYCRSVSEPYEITVTRIPEIEFEGTIAICEGGIINLSVTEDSPTGTWSIYSEITGYDENYDEPLNAEIYQDASSYHILGAVPDYVTVKYTTSEVNGSCASIKEIPVYPLPDVTITPETSSICEGSDITLHPSSNQESSFQWDSGPGCSAESYALDNTCADWEVEPDVPSSTYNLTVVTTHTITVEDGITQTLECFSTVSKTIEVLPEPDVSVDGVPTNPVCALTEQILTPSVSGATGTITYSWDGGTTWYGATDAGRILTFSPASDTICLLIVRERREIGDNAYECEKELDFNISVYSLPTFTYSVTQPICNGDGNGAIQLSASGGTPYGSGNSQDYRFRIDNGDYETETGTQNTFTGLSVSSDPDVLERTFTVTVEDSHGCTSTCSAMLNQPSQLGAEIQYPPTETCEGQSIGSATVMAAGGTPFDGDYQYLYQWSNGDETAEATYLGENTYMVTVTDANGCTATNNVTITARPVPSINASTTASAVCLSASDATISVMNNNTLSIASHSWSVDETTGAGLPANLSTESITVLPTASGTYRYTDVVTAENGCVVSGYVDLTVNQTVTLTLLSDSPDVVLCVETPWLENIQYQFDGAATGATVTGLPDGITASVSGNVVTISGTPSENVESGDYTYTVTTTGVQVPCVNESFTGIISISRDATLELVSAIGTDDQSICLPGTFTNIVYTYGGGATGIDEDMLRNALPAGLDFTVNTTAHTVTIYGTPTETGTFEYVVATTGEIPPCKPEEMFGIITISESVELEVVGNTTQNFCLGTALSDIVFTYGGGATGVSVNGTLPAGVQSTIDNAAHTLTLSGTPTETGHFAFSVTTNGAATPCSDNNIPVSIIINDVPNVSIESEDIACHGSTTDIINTISGGTVPYSYSWNNGATTENLSGVTAGSYSVTITDTHTCTASASVTISQPTELIVSLSAGEIGCNNGTTDIANTVNGGTTPYTYAWSNSATSQNLSDVGAGTYSVTVTDANDCTSSASVTISQPDELTASLSATEIIYSGETSDITNTVSGGTAPYSYTWSNSSHNQNLTGVSAGTYYMTVTDANGCTASSSIDIAGPQLYRIVANSNNDNYGSVSGSGTYDAGLTATLTAMPTEHHRFVQWNDGNTDNPRTITVIADATYIAEFAIAQHTITVLSANGAMGAVSGDGTYDYGTEVEISATASEYYHFVSWSDGNTDNPRTVTIVDDEMYIATFAIDQFTITVSANNYSMGSVSGTGTYNYGSEIQISATPSSHYHFAQWNDGNTVNPRTITVTQNADYTANFAIDQHTITLTSANEMMGSVNGGGTFNYGTGIEILAIAGEHYHFVQWSDGNTDNPRMINVIADATYTAEFSINQFTITVTSADETMGSVSEGGIFNYGETVQISAIPVLCHRFVQWNDGNMDNPRTITAAEDASYTAFFEIDQIIVSLSSEPIGCYGGITNITIEADGGTAPYNYVWSNGASSHNLEGVGYGSYSVTVIDNNGCSTTVVTDISEPYQLNASLSAETIQYNGGTTDIANTVDGGTAPYSYLWSNSATTQNLDAISAGTYSVSVTDNNSCTATASITVTEPELFTIVVSPNNEAMGTTNGGGTYDEGTEIAISATSAGHCHFVQWSDGNTDNPRTITVIADAIYTAEFAFDQYTITVLSANSAMGTVSESRTYDYGTEVEILATASDHHHFVSWSDGNTDNPRIVTVTGDVMYIATFAIDQITINVTANDYTMGTVSGGGIYNYGAERQIYASPYAHYRFVQWNDGNTDNPRTINVTADATYTAEFEIAQITITASSDNEEIGTVSGSGSYEYGAEIQITATAIEHYHFVQWNDGNTDNPRTITVTEDATYTAEYAIDQFTIAVVAENETMGTVSGEGTYDYGSTRLISATPAEHYNFVQWNDGNTDNPRTITVTENVTYTASFEISHITIMATSADESMGTVYGGGSYGYSAEIQITATATEHYHFVQWNDGNTENPRTIIVNENATYTATFAIDRFTIAVISANENMGSVSEGGSFDYGTETQITANAVIHYHFVSWNDGNTENPRTITVTEDATYTAIFAIDQHTITVSSANEEMGTVYGGGTYNYGSITTIMALANEGYRFVSWNDNNTENPRTITVMEDATYIATFEDGTVPVTYYTFSDTACGSYTWNDQTYTESGEYYQTFTTANSSDSIAKLELVVIPVPEPEITIEGVLDTCHPETTSVTLLAGEYQSYLWSNGETTSSIIVTAPDNYYVEVVDENGCHGVSEMTHVGYRSVLTEAPQITRVVLSTRTGYNIIQWQRINNESIVGYKIFRENTETNVYVCIDSVNRNKASCEDHTSEPSARAYRYKICAVDECGGLSPMSDFHKTMHLTINRGVGTNWNLIWSHYEGLEFSTYKIWRGTNPRDMVVIGEIPSTLNSFTDIWNTLEEGMYYRVEILQSNSAKNEEFSISSNIVANEFVERYSVSAFSNNLNFGTVYGGGTYPAELNISLAAIPNEGYEFISWNDGNTENPRVITVTENATYIASFAEIPPAGNYILTTISANPEHGRVTGGGTYPEGSVVPVEAIANDGYQFVQWNDDNTDNPREITVTENAVYVAYFSEVPAEPTYTITAVPTNPAYGTVTGSGTYPVGTVVTIEAVPNDGYEFFSWNDDNTDNPREITVTENAVYIARFTEVPPEPTYTITVISANPNHGTVTGGGTYTVGTVVTIEAVANDGFQFVQWSDNNTDNPREITVTENAVYIARFTEVPPEPTYTITVISANPNHGTVTGGGTYPEGTVVTIEAIANDGYQFSEWDDENDDNPRQITVTSDAIYVASFNLATDIEENIVPEISLYPNPTNDLLNISSSEEISEIEIVNVMGQVVLRKEINADKTVCDVEDLPSGVYLVRIHNIDKGTESLYQHKFVKK